MPEKHTSQWLAFLRAREVTPTQAEEMPRQERTKLNADFICWNMDNVARAEKMSAYSRAFEDFPDDYEVN